MCKCIIYFLLFRFTDKCSFSQPFNHQHKSKSSFYLALVLYIWVFCAVTSWPIPQVSHQLSVLYEHSAGFSKFIFLCVKAFLKCYQVGFLMHAHIGPIRLLYYLYFFRDVEWSRQVMLIFWCEDSGSLLTKLGGIFLPLLFRDDQWHAIFCERRDWNGFKGVLMSLQAKASLGGGPVLHNPSP